MQPRSEGRIIDLLWSNGIEPSSVGLVPNSVVYKVRVGGEYNVEPLRSGEGFIKLVDDAGLYRELVKANNEPPGVGLPDSVVIEDDELAALVSAPAEGWPLSRVLPVAFLPGVWRVVRDGLVSGYEAMGEYIKTLHERLAIGVGPIRSEHLTKPVKTTDQLSPTTRKQIEAIYTKVIGTEVPIARIKSDLTPHNAFYRSGDTTLIDFSLKNRPRVREIANLQVSLDLMARRLPYTTTEKATHLAEAFKKGYSLSLSTADERTQRSLLVAFEISYLCKILNGYLQGTSEASVKTQLFRSYDRRWVLSIIETKAGSVPGIGGEST